MEEKRELVELTIRSCISRLDGIVTEQQVQHLIENLLQKETIKEIVDSLALSVDKFFGKSQQKEQYEACMEDILKLAGDIYKSKEEIIAELQDNKAKNYIPGNLSVEDNHKLISKTLKTICDKLNELGVDYYLVGALSSFIGTRNTTF